MEGAAGLGWGALFFLNSIPNFYLSEISER